MALRGGQTLKSNLIICIAVFVSVSLTMGCTGTQPEESEVSTGTTMLGPDGRELYSYITDEDPYKQWELWPGKGELYAGTSPHGVILTTYVSDSVYSAIESKKGVMPYESIIVKENYDSDRQLIAISVLYKVKDYDAEHNDWFWAKYSEDGSIDAEGKVTGCIVCHGSRMDNDYIFTGDL